MKILGLFTHWIWFIDTQNRFYFIVKRLKNAFLMDEEEEDMDGDISDDSQESVSLLAEAKKHRYM